MRDLACSRLETVRQRIQLPLHRLRDALVQRGAFAREAGHRRLHDRFERRAGSARAVRDALLQRLLDRCREARVCDLRLAVKRLLARKLALVESEAVLLHRGHHRLQTVDQRRHQFRLPLQEPEALVTLMSLRIDAQARGDPEVELLRRFEPLAAAQRGQQAQHRGTRHARDRRAEREAQSLHRRGQRSTDRGQIGRAFERHAGAAQGHDHAEQRAEHAEQHQQADEIRRERRPRQRDALAFDAKTNRIAQARMQFLEPRAKPRRRLGEARDGAK